MLTALALTLPLLCAAPQHAQGFDESATTYSLSANPAGGPARIPFEFLSNEVRIDATINGHGPFHLILDTGMPIPGVLLFRDEAVDALGLADSGAHVQIGGAGGNGASSDAVMAKGVAVTLGDLKVAGTGALVVAPPAGFPPGVDGVVGGLLFFHYVVRIDLDKKCVELREPAGWTPPPGACSLPLANEGGKIFVDLRVAVGAEEPVPAHVVVDIGAGHALSLNERADGRFAAPEKALEAPLGRGVSGVVSGKLARVRHVELGAFAFDGVVTSFPSSSHGDPSPGSFHDGNLGMGILKRFNLTFDYASSRMILEKGASFGEPFEADMSGLALDWGKDGSLAIQSVLPHSPAAESDLQEGDQVLSIDGKSTEVLGENGVRKALTVDGAEVRLALRRGAATLEKKIRLRRLV